MNKEFIEFVRTSLGLKEDEESKKITEKLLSKHRGPVIFIPVPEGYKDPGDVPHDVLINHIHFYLGGNYA